jgi:hypothetical protein
MPSKASRSQRFVEIRIIDATVTTQPLLGRDEVVVVYGKVMPDFFGEEYITIPDYQRMAMDKGEKHQELIAAYAPKGSGVANDPLILLDDDCKVEASGAGIVVIRATVFNMADGHQRLAAARERLKRGQTTHPLLIKFILGVSIAEQRDIFYQTNRHHTPVSTQVHLRNIDDITVIKDLRTMAEETPGFPKLKLDQLDKPGEDITVRMLYEVAALLHGYKPTSPEDILDNLEELTKHIGSVRIVDNTKRFFEELKNFKGTELERFMFRRAFMGGLAALFSAFEDFWDKKDRRRLAIKKGDIQKLQGTEYDTVRDALGKSSARRAVSKGLTERMRAGNRRLTERTPPWKQHVTSPTVKPATRRNVDDKA